MEFKFTSKELRKEWLNFYKERGHVDCGAVSLIGDGTTGVMFNVAGMQPLMPYLLGKPHPKGTRLTNVQGCVRTVDIESVGDKSHCTFFEMLGSWSLGDYFKKERTTWSYELLTQVLKFDPERIAVTCFEGNEFVPKDEETAKYREESGIKKENIYTDENGKLCLKAELNLIEDCLAMYGIDLSNENLLKTILDNRDISITAI